MKGAPWYTGSNGATNMTRSEAQSFARKIVTSQSYRDSLEQRLLKGDLPPAVETMLWHYAFGKPPDTVNVNVSPVSHLSSQELVELTRQTLHDLEEATRLEQELEGELETHPTIQ